MKQKELKKIFTLLDVELLEQFQDPCENCGYFECSRNILNSEKIIKKRYCWNDIAWRHCLKTEKRQLTDLMDILRLPDFRKWSHEKCQLCEKLFFKHDMKLQMEMAKEPSSRRYSSYEAKLFRLCTKCNRKYAHMKKALHEGFEK